ncbi:MAG: class I poly(R)-hydroxyalkanoic acid synthase, partial [Sedimenticola sp.]|nr:class I poly(R)-hydroxyalkanoic acid synthase [Sedimenticola sp.]
MSKTDQSEVNTLGFASTTMELQKNFKQVEEIMANFAKSYEHMDLDPFNLVKSSAEWYTALAKDPQKAINANLAFMQKSMELYQQSLTNLLGGTVASDPVIQEDRGDRRFKHEGWAEQPAFNAIKQSYL